MGHAGELEVITRSGDVVQGYAAGRLKSACEAEPSYPNTRIRLVLDSTIPSEAYRNEVTREGRMLSVDIRAGDSRGFLYGTDSLLTQLSNGPETVSNGEESPHFEFRAIKFHLPWQSYRKDESSALHREACRDLAYWESFLDMKAENRFNVLTLWNSTPSI